MDGMYQYFSYFQYLIACDVYYCTQIGCPPKAKVRGSNPLGCAIFLNLFNCLIIYKFPEIPVFVDFWYVQILYKN